MNMIKDKFNILQTYRGRFTNHIIPKQVWKPTEYAALLLTTCTTK